MQIGFVREFSDRRVILVPDTVKQLIKEGHSMVLEKGAGLQAHFYDEDYKKVGAEVKERKEVLTASDLLVSINPLPEEDIFSLKNNCILISSFSPFSDPEICQRYARENLTAFSLDMIPRSTIAQSMDVLSSMASIAGYKAIIKAAEHLPRYLPMLSTAAGTIPPAKVLILGAGVAGLQAIATAKRLGAVVEAFDTRAAAKEEVLSLGAKFVEVEGGRDDKSAGGYAVEQSEDYKRRQKELVAQKVSKADIVVTTAQLRGKPAPTLITEEMVRNMPSGSVIVDLAASTGGNCELTQDEAIIQKHQVTIIGSSHLANDVSMHASQLYSKNVHNFMKQLMDKEGNYHSDFENEILKSSCIIKNGEILYNQPEKALV
ncbi:Re/Si-specific NAD(P)(+) transhydrogenase subunit alpha [Xanthovirga aplysinae]|uniref:Re/Si-specific NAD(P)(+) transhydrogenase subunit alpha n=1 Tax=Xanthovirga aplysinae TaxID=2529853 RepID=UPI0012BC4066|nr:Re/Si-specific NAD(P)(+) transhydrogenase subunit alpha [Xanthovirga aplysinae]MTI30773.1 Re/Si-specific NAD(P)(+) transhydrogenase subunit alpha [Xanthovirga aplysinae]